MGIIKGAISFGSNFNIGAKGPIDARMRVETIADLTTAWTTDMPAYEGMSVICMEDSNIYVLTAADATVAANWKKIGDASGDITNLQTQITANKTAAETAQATAEKANTRANASINAIVTGDKILSVSSSSSDSEITHALSADVSLSYDSSAKKLYLYGKNKTAANAISTIDCSSFVKDGMLKGSALYKATAATGTVTIGGESYSLSGLTSGKTYIVLVWNADASKDPMTIDVTSLIDTYTAGDGLTLEGNQFSIDGATAAGIISVKDPTDASADKVTLQSALDILTVKADSGVRSINGKYGSMTFKGRYADGSDNAYKNVYFGNVEDGNVHALGAYVEGLGTAATKNIADFATAAQGAKADSAVQSINGDDYIVSTPNGTTTTVNASNELKSAVTKANNSVQLDVEGSENAGSIYLHGSLYLNEIDSSGYDDEISISPDTWGLSFHNTTDDSDIILRGILNPTADNDAANKAYVDTKVSTAMSSAMMWAGWN